MNIGAFQFFGKPVVSVSKIKYMSGAKFWKIEQIKLEKHNLKRKGSYQQKKPPTYQAAAS